MTQRTNLYAFTEQPQPGAHYPGYVSLNREPDGNTTLTVRSPGHGGNQVGTITLPASVQTKLGAALKFDVDALVDRHQPAVRGRGPADVAARPGRLIPPAAGEPGSNPTRDHLMNDQAIETEIQAKGLTAPRVTLDQLNANIVSVEIVKHVAPSGQVLRWAVLTTRNGYAVTGRPSVSVSPENDNAELGEQLARDNARNELWPLMGYELKTRVADAKRKDACELAHEG